MFELQHHLRQMGRPADEDTIRSTLSTMKGIWPGAEWDTWSTAG